MIFTVLAVFAASAAAGSGAVPPKKNAPAASDAAQNTLPSGASDAFRQQMLEWRTAPQSGVIRIRNRAEARAAAQLSRLTISSTFGTRVDPINGIVRHHDGIDLPAHMGSRVMATGAGVVRIAGWVRGYGNLIEIAHAGGVTTRYGHLSSIDVRPGEPVHEGEIVGRVGSTGHSTGPHLHYEVRLGGSPVNPLRYQGGPAFNDAVTETVWGPTLSAEPRFTGWQAPEGGTALPAPQIR